MYTNYNQWPYASPYPYARMNHTNVYQPHPSMNNWYANGFYSYGPSQPFTHSPPYYGYTENAEMGGWSTANKESFQAGAIPKSVMNYFQDEQGQLDFDKMMSTTGQVMKTVQQVSPIVKGIGTFVKGIK